MSKKKVKPVKPVRAWGWLCNFGLCQWAEPTKQRLIDGRKPSPEAKLTLVRLIPESDYRDLLAQARQAKKKGTKCEKAKR